MINVNKRYQFLVYAFFFGFAQAQVNDNFSDGDFTTNPVWSGTSDQFVINSSDQLQLHNSMAGSSYLSTPFDVSAADNFEWTGLVKQSFSPSSTNFGRVYLISDQRDLTQPLNGYYLQFGEAGSNDAIELFRQVGSIGTSVCRGTNGRIASSFTVRVDVLRDNSGQWKLLVDYAGGTNFVLDAEGADSTFHSSAFFGVMCVYTPSNSDKFTYDDFYAGPKLRDTTPPVCQSVLATSANTLTLSFSEALNPLTSALTGNYNANNSLGFPQTAVLLPDNKTVVLAFGSKFLNGIQYQLAVSGIRDLAGNIMTTSHLPFSFLQTVPAQPKDLIITEILADPLPQIGLPNAEFIEIYNRSTSPFDLSGWKLSDGLSTVAFLPQIILPKQYWIITSSSAGQNFTSFGNVIGVNSFPTLNNDGDDLVLVSPEGITVDSVNYTLKWYHDPDKADGGWSLELIDLDNPCGEENNWTASEDPRGGTPGSQNSVNASKPDLTGPRLVSIVPVAPNQLIITFDKRLDKSSPGTATFSLTPPIEISKALFGDLALRTIQLNLGSDLQFRQRYTLNVQHVYDCNGNLIQEDFSQLDFALPQPADSLDIVVNEILFNPRPNGVDFVEVYNRSVKYINLNHWKLANIQNGIPIGIQQITSADFILAPHCYLAFTNDPGVLKNNYPLGQEGNFFQTGLPSLPDDEGSIALLNDHGRTMDYFSYSKGFHSRLLKDDEGVSLERISFSNPTNDSQNWESASSQAGFATPGYLNSCARPDYPFARGTITVEPAIFIAGSGGLNFTKINYAFDDPGFVANVKIVDEQGRIIKTITNNEILGFTGFFRWDGDRDDGSKARIGYYLVWAEVFDASGNVTTFRKRVIVANR